MCTHGLQAICLHGYGIESRTMAANQADVSYFAAWEVKSVKTPCEAVCQGLRHSEDKQGSEALSASYIYIRGIIP